MINAAYRHQPECSRAISPRCHSRAGGNLVLVPAGPAISYAWVPACAGMTA